MTNFLLSVLQITLITAAIIEEPKEAYFNGSGYLRLLTPMPIWGHSAISLRTCKGIYF